MAKPSVTLRNTKGSALTFTEADDNFTNLRDATITITDGSTPQAIDLNGTITFASGTGISVAQSAGTLTITNTAASSALNNVVEDLSPQLGGNLDVNVYDIVSTGGNPLDISASGNLNLGGSGLTINGGGGALTWPTTDGTNGYVLTTNGVDTLSWTSAAGGLAAVVDDTTPQLGGALDGQGNEVSDIQLDNYKEVVYTGGSTTGTITPDVANGNVQKITLTGSITLNAFANAEAGQSMTLIVTQPSSGGPYTLTSTMKFAGGTKTLSTAANAVDIISIFYDGSTYYASLATNFS